MGAIRGRDAIYVWTDTALFTQRFVGQPFTLLCTRLELTVDLQDRTHVLKLMVLRTGCQKMVSLYAGKLESLPCLVEDFVYDDINLDLVIK